MEKCDEDDKEGGLFTSTEHGSDGGRKMLSSEVSASEEKKSRTGREAYIPRNARSPTPTKKGK